MRLGLRLLFGFFLIAGLAAYFILRVVLAEVKPSVREVMEDILVDSANLLAEMATPDLRAMPAGGNLQGTRFALAVQDYLARPVDARIWGLHKRSLDLRVYVTDAQGRIVFDSGAPAQTGADYSRWRDVMLTLRGEYGARSSRDVAGDDASTVMVVAAPVRAAPGGATIGVLSVAKPLSTVQQFIDRAERKITVAGAWLLVASLSVGVLVTWWTVHAVRRLRRYAQQAAAGGGATVPALPGELGELALAMGTMRERLDRRAEVEQGMRALTHELKSPLTAIGGAAELLHESLPAADRQRFATQIGEQVQRLRDMVDRLLELSKLESLRAPQRRDRLDLPALVQQQLQLHAATLAQRGLQCRWLRGEPGGMYSGPAASADSTVAPSAASSAASSAVARAESAVHPGALLSVPGDPEMLAIAVSNLIANAMDFGPAGSSLDLDIGCEGLHVVFSLRDHGPGVPAYAQSRLGERFFSTPRPRDGRKGSGLGLAIVQQVARLHGGGLVFEHMQPGLCVRLRLPAR